MKEFNYNAIDEGYKTKQKEYEEKIFNNTFYKDTGNQTPETVKNMNEKVEENTRLYRAFQTALQTREFEINLFWKRALFFWGFISVGFVAYWRVVESIYGKNGFPDSDTLKIPLIAISVVINLFCLFFHLANKGSKYWQENWEAHIALLEPRVMGDLFMTTIKKDETCFFVTFLKSLFCPAFLYDFSVSKLTTFVSLIMVIASWGMVFYSIYIYFDNLLFAFIGIGVLIVIAVCIAYASQGNKK